MGNFAAVVFIFSVISLGMSKLVGWAIPKGKTKSTTVTSETVVTQSTETKENNDLYVLVRVLENEGYMSHVKVKDEDIKCVHNPVISSMIEVVSQSVDLVWKAPLFRLRIRSMDETFKNPLGQMYTHVLLTPTHAIGFDLHTSKS